jgi:hypothetical protein
MLAAMVESNFEGIGRKPAAMEVGISLLAMLGKCKEEEAPLSREYGDTWCKVCSLDGAASSSKECCSSCRART